MGILNYEIIRDPLVVRDINGDSWTTSGAARWAFFAIFVVIIFIILLGTMRVNKRRARQGVQPIYGTSWMTPPSYRQSQNQYQQPDHVRDPDLPSAYVPAYTATANEYDMGYYDNTGNYHANPNAKAPIPHPPESHQRSPSMGDAAAATTLPTNLHGNNGSNESIGDLYRAPNGPPPSSGRAVVNDETRERVGSSQMGESSTSEFTPPAGPPPRSNDVLIEGSSSSSSIYFFCGVRLLDVIEFCMMYVDHKVYTHIFQKRSSSGGAGFIFLANILALLIAVVIIGMVNKRRRQRGVQPIYGTQWITPPSYRQSQNQYDQPDHIRDADLPSSYVPTYTATANEHDMGYYDASGKFHPNPNVKELIPRPPPAHQRIESNGRNASPAMNDLPASLRIPGESVGHIWRPPLAYTSHPAVTNSEARRPVNPGDATAGNTSRNDQSTEMTPSNVVSVGRVG
ncbi:Protein RCR2 [Spathaspora sp. JA1]|nr:Protein RCR2 [Spathaspora sp. JA1]